MRGEILRYDDMSGEGLISGDDGNRYRFSRSDLQQLTPLTHGMRVDFDAVDGHAKDVFLITGAGQAPAGSAKGSDFDSGRGAYAPGNGGPAQPGYTSQEEPIDESSGPGMWGYFTKCIGMYINGNGRAMRAEYWSFTFFVILFVLLALLVDLAWNSAAGLLEEESFLPILTILTYLFFVIPSITVTIRRLHDVGMTGWLYLINFVPYIGGIFLFVVSLIPSQRQTNSYGRHPKASVANVFS
jgi:uncharacterized membrane protein YhaH (DUF805 family)/cold shock CspA family protein